jgi:flagellin-like protein
MKGVSAIIATILMLMITIALTGTAYLYISGFFGSRTSVVLSLDLPSRCNATFLTVYVRNDGTRIANNINIDLTFPDGTKSISACSIPIITAGGSNSTVCSRTGKPGGTYSIRAYGNGATATGPVYCG